MLATLPQDPSYGIGCVPLWAGLFSSFMKEHYHVDGFIANQGGEDSAWDNGVTYVITDLSPDLIASQTAQKLQENT